MHPKMAVSIGMANVEEVPLRIMNELVGLGDQMGDVSGSRARGKVEEAERFAGLAYDG